MIEIVLEPMARWSTTGLRGSLAESPHGQPAIVGGVTEFGFRSSLAESPHGRRRSCEERARSSFGGPSQEWCRVCVTRFREHVVVACESLAEVEQGLLRLRGRGGASFVFVERPR